MYAYTKTTQTIWTLAVVLWAGAIVSFALTLDRDIPFGPIPLFLEVLAGIATVIGVQLYICAHAAAQTQRFQTLHSAGGVTIYPVGQFQSVDRSMAAATLNVARATATVSPVAPLRPEDAGKLYRLGLEDFRQGRRRSS